MATAEGFEGYAIVEVFGHRQVAGFVRQVSLFGAQMARIDVPEVPERKSKAWDYNASREVERVIPAIPAFTHYYGGSAIFSMVPTTEELARAAAARFRSEPPQPLAPVSRQLESAPPDAELVEERRDLCVIDGCDADGVIENEDGDPLCQEHAYLAQGETLSQKREAEVGGATAAAGGSSGAPGSEPAPPTEAGCRHEPEHW
jgi:hypothetical protein